MDEKKNKNCQRRWSDNEITFLKENYKKILYKDIGIILSRTISSINEQLKRQEIRNKMKVYGIKEKPSKEANKKNSISHLGKQRAPFSEDTKKKMSISHIGIKRNPLSEETKIKIKVARAKQITPKKDTSIEIKIQKFLEQLGIEYFAHKYIKEIEHGYQCDIFIPSMNLVIECDGNYWHSYPTGKEIDHIRTKELLEKGFKVLRLWEFEIREMDLNRFRERLI